MRSFTLGLAFLSATRMPSGLADTMMFDTPSTAIGMSSSLIICTFLESPQMVPLPISGAWISSVKVFQVPRSFHSPA
ncbi:hypothetical protein D3C81_2266290 [compost metagenome]